MYCYLMYVVVIIGEEDIVTITSTMNLVQDYLKSYDSFLII